MRGYIAKQNIRLMGHISLKEAQPTLYVLQSIKSSLSVP